MGHVDITQEDGTSTRLGGDPQDEAFRRWVEDRQRLGSVCSQPGRPGSSPACLSCTASCSSEPADVDPEEPPACPSCGGSGLAESGVRHMGATEWVACPDCEGGLRPTDAARLAQWDLDRVEGRRG